MAISPLKSSEFNNRLVLEVWYASDNDLDRDVSIYACANRVLEDNPGVPRSWLPHAIAYLQRMGYVDNSPNFTDDSGLVRLMPAGLAFAESAHQNYKGYKTQDLNARARRETAARMVDDFEAGSSGDLDEIPDLRVIQPGTAQPGMFQGNFADAMFADVDHLEPKRFAGMAGVTQLSDVESLDQIVEPEEGLQVGGEQTPLPTRVRFTLVDPNYNFPADPDVAWSRFDGGTTRAYRDEETGRFLMRPELENGGDLVTTRDNIQATELVQAVEALTREIKRRNDLWGNTDNPDHAEVQRSVAKMQAGVELITGADTAEKSTVRATIGSGLKSLLNKAADVTVKELVGLAIAALKALLS